MFDWDNLRIFLELTRSQNLTEAARKLGIDHSTVSRRMRRFEEEIGTQLFDRSMQGYVLTAEGTRLLGYAERAESTITAAGEELGGHNRAASGHVRIGGTEGFGAMFLAPHLAKFCSIQPKISVDLITMPRLMNLSKREADIIVSIERPTASGYLTAKLSTHVLGLYGTRDYLDSCPPIETLEDLKSHACIGYVDELLFSSELQYKDMLAPHGRYAFRSTSISAQYQAVLHGKALAILPWFLACRHDQLVPVLPDKTSIHKSFWLIADKERRQVARIAATWNYLREVADLNRDFLLGRTREMTWHPGAA